MVEAILVVVPAAALTGEAEVDAAPQQAPAQVARDALGDLGGLWILLSDDLPLPQAALGQERPHVFLD